MDEMEKKLGEKLGLEFIGDEPLLNVILRHHRVGDLLRECLSLMQGSEWIKCSERLPEFNTPVLLYVGGDDRIVASNQDWAGRVFLGMLTASDGKWWSYAAHASGGPVHESVTHWREIGLPKEGSRK